VAILQYTSLFARKAAATSEKKHQTHKKQKKQKNNAAIKVWNRRFNKILGDSHPNNIGQ